jgi:hypothetical protein
LTFLLIAMFSPQGLIGLAVRDRRAIGTGPPGTLDGARDEPSATLGTTPPQTLE